MNLDLIKKTLIEYIKNFKIISDSDNKPLTIKEVEKVKVMANIAHAIDEYWYQLRDKELERVVDLYNGNDIISGQVNKEPKKKVIVLDTNSVYGAKENKTEQEFNFSNGEDEAIVKAVEMLKAKEIEIPYDRLPYNDWLFFHKGVPIISAFKSYHTRVWEQGQFQKIYSTITKSKNVQAPQLAMFKALLEKNNNELAKLGKVNSKKELIYHLPTYRRDAINQRSTKEMKNLLRSKAYLYSLLEPTFDDNGELIQGNTNIKEE